MAKSLKLYLNQPTTTNTVWVRRSNGVVEALPTLRLIAYANFLRVLTPSRAAIKYAITECVVDTGSPYSIISDALWRRFRPGFVTPLPFDSRTPQRHRSMTVAGGRYPYTLGELTVQLEDQDRNILPVTIIAQLIQDGGRLPMPLTLGLRGGFLEGRRLSAGPTPTLPFEQTWTIEDP